MRRSVAIAFAICSSLTAVAYADSVDKSGSLPGLWGGETMTHSFVEGMLTIDGRDAHWRGDLGGFDVAVQLHGDRIELALPDDQGRFRGHLSADKTAIDGFWIRPPGVLYNRAYATPLRLRALQKNVWVGHVLPLQEASHEYLSIERAATGALSAFIRNPELNIAREKAYDVRIDGNAVTFSDPKRAEWQLHGALDEASAQLSVDWPEMGVFVLTRRDRDQAPGFFPRTPAPAAYVWRQPVDDADGWSTASLREAGFDEPKITALVEQLASDRNAARAAAQVHSLLIARHGKLVVEEYFHGFDRERVHDMRSASKTFAPMLVGLAIERNKSLQAGAPILRVLPPFLSLANPDPRKAAITVANLMTMTSGLACDDNNDDSPGNEDVMQSQTKQNDWYRYTLDLPMARDPGGDVAVYCSAGVNLLGAIVVHSTGTWLPDFFASQVAQPLQMRGYHINLMPNGDAYLGGGMQLRPRDFLKLGQVYLARGMWNGKRIIDRRWVEESVAKHTAFAPDHAYGYGWHLQDFDVGGRRVHAYNAGGNGGQFVIIVPEFDLVVGLTAGNYGDFKTWSKLRNLLADYVIPAAGG